MHLCHCGVSPRQAEPLTLNCCVAVPEVLGAAHRCSAVAYEVVNSELSWSINDHMWEDRVCWGSHCQSHHLTGTCTTVTDETHPFFWKMKSFARLLGPHCAFYCPSHINTTLMFYQRLLLTCSPSFSWGDSDLSLPWQNQGWFSPCSSRSFTGSLPFPWLCLQTGDTRDLFKNHAVDKMYYSDSDRHRKAGVYC